MKSQTRYYQLQITNYIKSVIIGIVNSSSLLTVASEQSTVNSQHHSGVTGNDITFNFYIKIGEDSELLLA